MMMRRRGGLLRTLGPCAFIALLGGLLAFGMSAGQARAAPRFVSCGGAAMLGGAILNCSHLAPTRPAQLCNFSWSLLQPGNLPKVVSGSFLLPSGANNIQVYQASGFIASLTAPIVLCRDQH